MDMIILGITFLSAILGFARGFVREIFGVISWVGGGILTYIGMPYMRTIARQFIEKEMVADIAAAIGLFVVFLIIFNIISHFLSNLIRESVLSSIDRALGFFFGLARGFIILSGVQLIIGTFLPVEKYPDTIRNNRFLPLIVSGSQWIVHISPQKVTDYILEQQKKLNQNGLTANVTKEALNAAQAIATNPALATDQNQSIASHPAVIANTQTAQDMQKAAEALAQLRPMTDSRANPMAQQTEGVTVKQEKALDKFLNTSPVDHEIPQGMVQNQDQMGNSNASPQIQTP